MSPVNGNGNGDCWYCGDDEYECAEENPCEPGGGGKPPYQWRGKVWLDNGSGAEIGVDVYARTIFKTDPVTGELIMEGDPPRPKHTVDVKLNSGVRRPPIIFGQVAYPVSDAHYVYWRRLELQRMAWQRWFEAGLDKPPEDE